MHLSVCFFYFVVIVSKDISHPFLCNVLPLRPISIVQIFCDVTGLDVNIVKRLKVLLAVLHSGRSVNWEKFHEYGVSTYRLLVQTYPWYYVPSSVHTLLAHAAALMSVLDLPPAFYDEGACNV